MNKAKVNQKRFYSSGPYSSGPENTLNTKSKWTKIIRIILKIVNIFSIGFIFRLIIIETWHVNVFVDYTHLISITYYFNMCGLSVFINEWLNNLDGPKIPMTGVDLPSDIKDYRENGYSGKDTNSVRKGIVCTMNDPTGNSGGQNSSTTNNNFGGGNPNSAQGNSTVEAGSSSNNQGTNVSDCTGECSNKANLGHICNHAPETFQVKFDHVRETIDTKLKQYLQEHPDVSRTKVKLRDLGYVFERDSAKNKWVVQELKLLKGTVGYFRHVGSDYTADFVLKFGDNKYRPNYKPRVKYKVTTLYIWR